MCRPHRPSCEITRTYGGSRESNEQKERLWSLFLSDWRKFLVAAGAELRPHRANLYVAKKSEGGRPRGKGNSDDSKVLVRAPRSNFDSEHLQPWNRSGSPEVPAVANMTPLRMRDRVVLPPLTRQVSTWSRCGSAMTPRT